MYIDNSCSLKVHIHFTEVSKTLSFKEQQLIISLQGCEMACHML